MTGVNRPVSFVCFCEFSPLLPHAHAPVDGCAPEDARVCSKVPETHKNTQNSHALMMPELVAWRVA
jgi:predicted nucleic acid-binding Zn ribbon protein